MRGICAFALVLLFLPAFAQGPQPAPEPSDAAWCCRSISR